MARGRAIYAGLAHRQNQLAMQEAVRNLAVYHISAVRMNKVRGITFVKHVAFGWISVQDYYRLQKLHDMAPFAIEVIRGGYALKAWIWQADVSFEVLASGTRIPFGVVLIVIAVGLAVVDAVQGNEFFSTIDLASLALPYGELWIMYRGLSMLLSLFHWVEGSGATPGNPLGLTLPSSLVLALSGGLGLSLDAATLASSGVEGLVNWLSGWKV